MTSDPDQIRGNIEQTQQNLSANVDALTEKVSPPKIMQRRVQQTRSSMTNVKDKIMGGTAERTSDLGGTVSSSASSARDTVASSASSAADAVGSAPDLARQRTRGNPLAAGLIAFGAGWLVASLLPATESEQQVAAGQGRGHGKGAPGRAAAEPSGPGGRAGAAGLGPAAGPVGQGNGDRRCVDGS